MPESSWQSCAHGIPVWPGARILFCGSVDTCTEVYEDAVVGTNASYSPADACVPALSNHDTRMAYLRRLAVRLGCPEEVADLGLVIELTPGWLNLMAGAVEGLPNEWAFRWVYRYPCPDGDTLAALALTWKAVKP
jgi:hypothetical protein